MITAFFADLGPWFWILLGLILLTAEILVPGVYLLWSGIAALMVGMLTFQFGALAFWSWHAQIVLFLLLSLFSAYVGSRFVRLHDTQSDEPLLNQPGAQLIGRTTVLKEPITDNRGRVQFGDTMWLVKGPDLPAGRRIRVTAVQGSELVVEPAPGETTAST